MTPKQILWAHVTEKHRSARRGGSPPKGASLVELARWHGRQHWRGVRGHYHEGVNLGPDDRPVGWRTGEGAVDADASTV